MNDRELIGAYLKGHEEAFRTFYERHRRALYVYLLSFVRTRETAEELLQETFYRFLRHVESLDGSSSYRPYLLRTARNRAIDAVRRERRGRAALEQRRHDPFFRKPTTPAFASAADDDGETTPEVERLLQRLPAEQKEAVVLKALGGLTFREIGRLTGVPENTAVSRYRYGLEKLRTAMSRGGCGERTR